MLVDGNEVINALVVGARGFIGRYLVSKLIEKGGCVTVLVRSIQNVPSGWISAVKIWKGDITEKASIAGICKNNNIEVVFHLAAKVHDLSEIDDTSGEHFAINVEGTRNLLNECSTSCLKHFIYFSSVKAMAEESSETLDETFLSNPTTPYGESKLTAEKLVVEYGKKHGFKTTSLRLPLVYGPGNKGNIYKMVEAVDKGRFVMVGRGKNKRSMVFVGNVIDAALFVVGRSVTDGKIYIVTDGIDYTMKELYETIAKRLGKRPLPFYLPMCIAKKLAWAGDIGRNILKSSLPFDSGVLKRLTEPFTFSSFRIYKDVGFKPKYNLYNTIDETIKWYKSSRS